MGGGSARECSIVLILLVAASLASAAQIYDVGDNAGWTVGVNYSTWGSNKTFHSGDTIVFVYDKSFHNVLEVSRADYRSCNAASPIAKHETGKDSVVLASYGHRFFICGFPGHCAAGQKLDIRIPKIVSASPPAAAAPSDGAIPAPGTSAGASSAPGSAPHGGNGAASIGGFGACVAAAAVAVAAPALFLL